MSSTSIGSAASVSCARPRVRAPGPFSLASVPGLLGLVIVLGWVLGLGAPSAHASVFSVQPVKVKLEGKSRTALLTVTNQSKFEVRLQVTVFEWAEKPNGEMVLTPTVDLVAFPSLFTVPAGDRRTLRLGSLTAAGDQERAYRVFVTELASPAGTEGANQIKVLLRMGIPVFVSPKGVRPDPQVTDWAVEGDRISFTLANAGGAHFRTGAIRLSAEDTEGESLRSVPLKPWYVLAGGHRRYSVLLPAGTCKRFARAEVALETELGPLAAEVTSEGATADGAPAGQVSRLTHVCPN